MIICESMIKYDTNGETQTLENEDCAFILIYLCFSEADVLTVINHSQG